MAHLTVVPMATHHGTIRIRTEGREGTTDITARVRDVVRASGIADGVCLVSSTHTTAAVFVNENADPDVQHDLLAALSRIVPDDATYRHAEGNSPAHIKAVLIGGDVTLAVREGDLVLGRWQGVYFAELDGPRTRVATVTVSGERAP
ncbi:MAG TPA: secondary thiamine-phosphate synthase enzyme YjbQ [Candidatus Limnocylindria bacterium]|nr:secondary thiamine-phosphate synthase enzyme YjbQ [Candidatus Limnocylindria bacterium]